MEIIRFQVSVDCPIPFSNRKESYWDNGLLLLPDSYSDTGTPTRLVINCHGAGGTVSTDDSQVEHQILSCYLLANGFAIMDVNGLPDQYSQEFGIDIRNNIGSPIATDSYVAAYHYCISHYNLKRDVFVHGGSMGGISSTNLVLSGRIPVIAQTGFCPVLDTYNEIFLHPWSGGLPKTALGILYSLDRDAGGEWIYREERIQDCNPMASTKPHPCPLLFCHCANDPVVNPQITKDYIARAKAQGVEAELLLLPDGGHEPQLYGEPVADPMGKTAFRGEILSITPAIEAVFRWISSHQPT